MTWRHLHPPAGWQGEIRKDLRTAVAQVFNMKRLEEIRILAKSITPPYVPTASARVGWMTQSVEWQLTAHPKSDSHLAFWHRWIELRTDPSAHILLFTREVVHVCLTTGISGSRPRESAECLCYVADDS